MLPHRSVGPEVPSPAGATPGYGVRVVHGRLLQQASELAPDGVLIVDNRGRIVYANRSIHSLAGIADLTGSTIEDLVPDDVRSRHGRYREAYAAAPTQRPMGSGLELALRRADGAQVPVEVSLSPFEDDGQLYVIAIVRDISERHAVQQRLAIAGQQLALAAERERIGRDLHDVVLQHLYGIGLTVQSIAAGADPVVTVRLDDVVDEIDKIIAAVRTIVFTLGSSSERGALGQELGDVVAQASRVLGFTPTLRLEGPVESVLSDAVRGEMVTILREALGNVARHARATQVEVVIAVRGEAIAVSVADNGTGIPDDGVKPGGHGLASLRSRARALGGECTLANAPTGGAVLSWSVPY